LSVEPVRRARPDRDTLTQAEEGAPAQPPEAQPVGTRDARLRSIETSLQQLRRQAQQLVAEIEKVEQELQQ
jgi:hypothetical protein